MKLSIVVICLNEEEHLSRCLEAITSQNTIGSDLEVIVVDGGSTDASLEIASKFDCRLLRSEPGIPRQRNMGARASMGNVLAYIDADVEIMPGWFATVKRMFDTESRQIIGCPSQLPKDASWIARAHSLHWGLPSAKDSLTSQGRERLLSTRNLVMGREVFDGLGGFDDSLAVDEDTAFLLKARTEQVPIVCTTELATVHHGEPRSLGEFFKRMLWGANYPGWFETLKNRDFRVAL